MPSLAGVIKEVAETRCGGPDKLLAAVQGVQ